ncbi:sigma-54-dependent Fis family transcriptional regulator [Nocardioides sp. AX2bis]|uniref:sigma-54-dependent Fis family transcriptional regulator n=1 Tax=Nocardioides sp. AX2bis TaxID=2653157 RepID=UPI0012EFE0C4|nr:helix-turn-helix domain-containing protein [Nocardioides sp. AX2bis]VXC00991.1 Transcriptional regulator of acetoin/glycerol metabolism [Nocardioides sp. AX2bis]
MDGGTEQHDLLTHALAGLLDGQPLDRPGVPAHVAASWRRSLANGVSPTSMEGHYVADLDLGARLVRCAEPVIDQLGEMLADVPACVALTDARARIVARKDTSLWISRMLDRVYFAQGFDYAEKAVGTNGVGTVLEFGASVQITGAEHFVDALQSFACAGAPVRDPFTGRIEGVLDISCLDEHSSPIMHSMVRSAATRVERNLLLDRGPAQQALFDLFSRVDARTREAVVAVGPGLTMANTAMEVLLGSTDRSALSDHLRFLAGRRPDKVDDRVVLPSGTEVRLRGTSTDTGGAAGMVAVVSRDRDRDVAGTTGRARLGPPVTAPAPRPRDDHHPGSSPGWEHAAATVEDSLRSGRSVLVLGEAGTGRATLLASTFTRLRPGARVVHLGASEVDAADPRRSAALTTPHEVPTLVVLHDLERVSRTAGAALAGLLTAHAAGPAALAATGCPSGIPGDHPLLDLLTDSVTVPPLRQRHVDLTALVQAVLAELDPHRRTRISEDALGLLTRYPWPGNVRELREVLVSALARRPVGTIGLHDLPAQCQSTPRSTLREVDRAERDAIVSALRRLGGNRKAAATTLGIARSTLYRKIRQYGITD